MLAELGHELRPVLLHEALAHQRDGLEQQGSDLLIWAAHQKADQVLLHNAQTSLVDKVAWVIFIVLELL